MLIKHEPRCLMIETLGVFKDCFHCYYYSASLPYGCCNVRLTMPYCYCLFDRLICVLQAQKAQATLSDGWDLGRVCWLRSFFNFSVFSTFPFEQIVIVIVCHINMPSWSSSSFFWQLRSLMIVIADVFIFRYWCWCWYHHHHVLWSSWSLSSPKNYHHTHKMNRIHSCITTYSWLSALVLPPILL